ncbi:hypothetical protein TA3x_001091 [Tundrisphaera sp. TA3]|uniref:hypothetical protein n=1 Tax=Tundrisphaera sp. TA3 TaxID=3435775 RepID=UPI003EBE80B8
MPLTNDDDQKALDAELQRIKSARYVESSVQVAGWNYEQSPDGRGFHFHELAETDRQVMVEDYVGWDRYMERGLTPEEQGRIMAEAARDPFPKMPEIAPLFTTEELRELHKGIEEDRFPGFRERMMAIPAVEAQYPEPAFRERFIRESFDREAAKEIDEIAARPGDPTSNLLANYSIRAAEHKIANDDVPESLRLLDPAELKELLADMREEEVLRRDGQPGLDAHRERVAAGLPDPMEAAWEAGRGPLAEEAKKPEVTPKELEAAVVEIEATFPGVRAAGGQDALVRADPLETARQRAKETSKEPGKGKDGPEIG